MKVIFDLTCLGAQAGSWEHIGFFLWPVERMNEGLWLNAKFIGNIQPYRGDGQPRENYEAQVLTPYPCAHVKC